jgi:ornithine carbamoyltransferase
MTASRAVRQRKPAATGPRHFLDLADFDSATLKGVIAAARRRKDARSGLPRGAQDGDAPLEGRMLAMIFERPSTRTRISFDVGMQELGGRTIMLTGAEMQPRPRENHRRHGAGVALRRCHHDPHLAHDTPTARRTCRGFGHQRLTKLSHPCQVMADDDVRGKKKADPKPHDRLTGDCNNVGASGFMPRLASISLCGWRRP